MADASSLTAGLTKASGAMTAFSRRMTKFLTLPILAASAASVSFALDFEKSMTDVEALVGMSAKQVAGFKEEILKLAPAVGKSPTELGEAFYFIASSGLKGESAMRALTASATAAAAGLGDTKTVADAVTSAINAYGEKTLSATRATDILTAAVREGKSEPEAFAGSIGRVIPIAAKLGVSFGEVAGQMAAMSLNGTDANEAVTQISAMLASAIKPTKDGAGVLKSIGMSYADLRNEIKNKGLTETVAKLDTAFKGNIETLGKLFTNIRALRGFLALTGPEAEKYAGIIARVSKAQGDAAKAAEIALSKPGAKLSKAWAGIQSALIQVGDVMLPVVAQAADSVAGLAGSFSKLAPSTQSFAVKAALAAAAAGPLVFVVSKIAGLAGTAGGAMLTLARSVAALSAASSVGGLAAFGSTLAAALGPIGIAVAAIAGTAGLTYAFTKLDSAATGAAKATSLAKQAAADIAADKSGNLQKWADKALGGHYVSKAGKIEWQPAITVKQPDTATITKGVREAAAAEIAAMHAASREKLLVAAQARQAELQQQIRLAKESLTGISGVGGQAAKENPQLKAYEAQLQKIDAEVTKLRGNAAKGLEIDKGHVASAQLKDLDKQATGFRKTIEDFKKAPKDVKLKMTGDYADAVRGLKEVTSARDKLAKETKTVRVTADMADAKAKLAGINKDLKTLGAQKPSPAVDLAISALQKKKATVIAEMRRLDAQIANPTVNLIDNVSAHARAILSLLNQFQSKTVTLTTITRNFKKTGGAAAGGIFSGPTSGYQGPTMHGTEAIIPLDAARASDAARVMDQTGLNLTGSATSAAKSATSSAVSVAKAVANAITKGLGGAKSKTTQGVKNAAETSSAIASLLDFVNGVTEALETLNKSTVPKLAAGWKAKVQAIVKQAAKLSTVIAAEVNKAFPWTAGKAKTKKTEAVDPKAGKRGVKLSQAAETSGPIGTLVDFIVGIAETVNELATATFPTITAEVKANVVRITKTAADLAKSIAAAIKQAFPKSISTTVTEASGAASQLLSDIAGILDTFAGLSAKTADDALAGMGAVMGKWTLIGPAVVALAVAVRDAFKDMTVDAAITDASSASAALIGDITSMLSGLVSMTTTAVKNGTDGLTNVLAAMPTLKATFPKVINAIRDALAGVTVEDALSETTSAVASVVGDVTGILGNLAAMTIKAVENGIGGAWTVANRAPQLGVALKAMVTSLMTALGAIKVESMDDVKAILASLSEIASSISSIVTNLINASTENVTNATAAGSALGGGFFDGLASWHARIVAEAKAIANDTVTALAGGPVATPAMATAGAVNQTVVHDNSVNYLVVQPKSGDLTPQDVRNIIREFDARKSAAAKAALRGSAGG
jgi:TP901 family phage tail tape measure protein